MLRRTRVVVPLLCLALAACSKCGKPTVAPGVPELTRYLPRDAELALVVPDVGALGQKLKLLEGLKIASFAAQLQGFANASEYASALFSQVGVEVRSSEELAKAGLDPARGLAVVLLPGGRAYSVVAVGDAAKLEVFLRSLATNRLGAPVPSSKTDQGVKVTWYSQVSGSTPRLGFVIKDGFAFIAAEAAVAGLAGDAALPAERSLSKDEALSASLARLPAARDLFVYVPSTSGLAKQTPLGGGVVAAMLTPEALVLKADVPWTHDEKVLGALRPKAGENLLPFLPADAFVALRFLGDPKLLAPYWGRLVGPHLERAFVETGFNFETEVLDNLKPGSAVALSVAPEAKIGQGMPALDVRRTNPFRYAHLTGITQVQDPAKGGATLEKLTAVAPRFGAKIEPADQFGQKVFLTSYGQGEGVHFASAGDKVVAGVPQARLQQMLERAAKPADAVAGAIADPGLRAAFEGHGIAAVVDLRRLAEAVKELPPEAWGIGGFAYKATTVRWLDATDDLRAVTVNLDSNQRALQAELTLRFQKK